MHSVKVISDLKSNGKALVLEKKEWDRLKGYLLMSSFKMEHNMTQTRKNKDINLSLSRPSAAKFHKVKNKQHKFEKAKPSETKDITDEYTDFQEMQLKEKKKLLTEENKKKFYMKEHVKSLNSAVLFSEVLRERNAQAVFEKKLKEELKTLHEQSIEHCRKQYKDYLQKKRNERWSHINKTKLVKKELVSQITEKNERIALVESMNMQRDKENLLYMEEEMRQSNIREKLKEKNEKEECLRKYLEYMENEKLIKEKLRHEKETQDKVICTYDELRNMISKLCQQKEKELQHNKLKKIEKAAHCLMASVIDTELQEDALLRKSICENNIRFKRHNTKREALTQKIRNDTIQQHKNFLERQAHQKREDLELQRQSVKLRLKQEEVNRRYIQQRKEERDQLNKCCKEICDHQVTEKYTILKKQQDNDRKLFNDRIKANSDEDKQFLAYVAEVIADSEQKGRPIFPVIKCAQEYQEKNNLLTVVKVPPMLVSRIPIDQQMDYGETEEKFQREINSPKSYSKH